MTAVLEKMDSWDFDVFALDEATGGRPLVVGGTHLIRRLGLLERLRIPVETLANFLDVVEARYHASNPFHNALHATDTLFTLQVVRW